MLRKTHLRLLLPLLAALPTLVLAHPGHGGDSQLQHDWEHALWLAGAAAVIGAALLARWRGLKADTRSQDRLEEHQ